MRGPGFFLIQSQPANPRCKHPTEGSGVMNDFQIAAVGSDGADARLDQDRTI
jgi:hypothetical protein